jgi:hypothetical protein
MISITASRQVIRYGKDSNYRGGLSGPRRLDTTGRTARAPFHCHRQLHMDYGFKMLFDVV